MMHFFSKKVVVVVCIVLGIVIVGVSVFFILNKNKVAPVVTVQTAQKSLGPIHTVIGKSVQGRTIDAYKYGNGTTSLVFVGGIHGGYEWNTVVLAYQFMDYLSANPSAVPANLSVTVIPSANPDGVYKIIGKEGRFTSADVPANVPPAPGRFNADNVDLNRNFDCKWQPQSTWQNKTVSAGTAPFSEPEAAALRDFFLADQPAAAVFWHSQSGSVYASQCEKGILPGTLNIMNLYAKASGYTALKTFDAYATTGGADDWLSTIGIPAVTVELTTHNMIEFKQNLAGSLALFSYFGK